MRLDEYLATHNMKALHLAKAAGLPPSTITRFLRRERGLSMESAFRIVAATNGKVSVEELRQLGKA